MNQNYLNLIKLYKDQNYNNDYMPNYHPFYDAIEGYSKGNMDKGLYNQMGNLTPRKLDSNNPLNLLRAYQFAIIDLQLYLDVNPSDLETKALFDKYLENYNDLKKRYESTNYPLTLDSPDNAGKTWKWQKNWPFKGGNN